ncbi:ATP-dependent zinc metalloprotease YME1L1-like [Chlorocebus sabaeus]|uniref:ATP-dependent zinc metalloprotease YME1L1-like n=1 Tax=Chlorocebus sabaeus TaxID=60711 RepID=UPI003BF9EC79
MNLSDSLHSAVRFWTTMGLDSAVDPVQMKNVTFEHVKGTVSGSVTQGEVHWCDLSSLLLPDSSHPPASASQVTVISGILLVGLPGTGKSLSEQEKLMFLFIMLLDPNLGKKCECCLCYIY